MADAWAIQTQVVPVLKEDLVKNVGLTEDVNNKLIEIEFAIDAFLNLAGNTAEAKTTDTSVESGPTAPHTPSAPPSYTSDTPDLYPSLPTPSAPNPMSYVVLDSGETGKRPNYPFA